MKVAEPTVERLIQYYRLLIMMKEEGRKVVSSLQMGEMLGIKASQVRKDLSYFGEIGKRGVGYHVNRLCAHIENILAKFSVEALFDVDPEKVGKKLMGVDCFHVDDIAKVMEERNIEVLILAVPAAAAQSCVDKAAASPTLKGILAFTPATVVVPDRILFYRVDIFVELEKLLFFLKEREK